MKTVHGLTNVRLVGQNRPANVTTRQNHNVPKKKTGRSAAAKRLDDDLAEIQRKLAKPGNREERTMHLVGALAIALRIMQRANEPKNRGTRGELVRRIKQQIAERGRPPSGKSAKRFLLIVKLCFPNSKLSDQSQYARFLAACLAEGWKSTQVEAKFRRRREKSKERAKDARDRGKKAKTATGIKVMASRGKVLLKSPPFLGKLYTLMEALG